MEGFPDMPVNVPVDDPNADTEWYVLVIFQAGWQCGQRLISRSRNDILRKHGIIPEKPPSPIPMIQEALIEAERKAYENRLEDKDLDELDALEDEEDEAFLDSYRQKRMAEMSLLQKASVHGQVYPLQKADYAREVTEASSQYHVLVNMTSSFSNNVESSLLDDLWRQLAAKYGDIKFCQIRADLCIEGYPERNCPTILAYKDGDIRRQVVTLGSLRGVRTKLQGESDCPLQHDGRSALRRSEGHEWLMPVTDLEQMLVELGAVDKNDMRLRQRDTGDDDLDHGGHKPDESDDDDDWD
ncbi:hypothetical protein KEM52_002816 [Ascosphaera acerosa]|nr:hypothetical protein KEM52_002816 [Ascosphaera acerosa]